MEHGRGSDSIETLRAREDEVAREWSWLQEAVNLAAQSRTGEEEADAFRLLQYRAIEIGQRRVELIVQLAVLERMNKRFETDTGRRPVLAQRSAAFAQAFLGELGN